MTAAQAHHVEGFDRPPRFGAVTDSLVCRYGDEFQSLGPIWLRTDLRHALWVAGPVGVLVLASPESLLRPILALFVAAGVALGLQWQNALAVQDRRCRVFVHSLARHVAEQMFRELSPQILAEVIDGHFRPWLTRSILDAAEAEAQRQKGAGS